MAKTSDANQVGWRFGFGVALIVCGYGALALIPAVTGSDLSRGIKSAITGTILLLPLLTKVGAVAIMGKPGFNFLKQHVFGFLGRFQPAQTVSHARYRLGLLVLAAALVFGELLPYFPGFVVDWKAHEIFWSLAADAVMIASLFILGGGFWDKLRALFTYESKAVFSDKK
jgi:hypothetical protein